MNHRIHRLLTVSTLALTLALAAAPAVQASPIESGRAILFQDLSGAFSLLWDLLTRAWGETGSDLDPNGQPGESGSSLDPDGSTAPGDAGSILDPNGAEGDEGSGLDPNGGR